MNLNNVNEPAEFSEQTELLFKSLEDNQNTIRFTDTKAGAVIVLAGIMAAFLSSISKDYLKYLKTMLNIANSHHWINFFHTISIIIILMACTLFILAIYLAFKSISPKSGPVDSVRYDLPHGVPNLFYLYNISPAVNIMNMFYDKAGYFKLQDKTSDLLSTVNGLTKDTVKTLLIYELQKVSYIRELKIQRVKKSIQLLSWSAVIFLLLGMLTSIVYLYN